MRNTSIPVGRAGLLAAAALSLAACAGLDSSGAAAPKDLTILPYCIENGAATTVTLRGTLPVKQVVSQSGGDQQVDKSYRAWLGDPSTSSAIELANVSWNDARSATATVPAGVAAGSYPVFVQGPFGTRVQLDKPVEVRATGCPPVNPVLTTVATATPSAATVGQEVTVTAVVQNGGQAPALSVTPLLASPPAILQLTSAPAGPQDVPGGQAATFTWKLKPSATTSAGGLTLQIDAAGVDLGGAPVAAPRATTNRLSVNPPATLTVTARPPQVAFVGQQFRYGLDLSNTGSAPATVSPVVTATATNGVQLTVVAPPGGQNVPGPGHQLLEWLYTASAPCDVTFNVDLSNATDANSGAHLTLPAIAAATVRVTARPQIRTTIIVLTTSRDPAYAMSGETVTVNADVQNVGTQNLTNVSASIDAATLPAGLTQAGSAPGAQDVAPGQTGRFTWNYTVGASPGGTFTVSFSVGGVVVDSGTAPLEVRYPIRVSVAGLSGGRTVVFTLSSNSEQQTLLFPSNGTLDFPTPVAAGAQYAVAISTLPTGRTCTWATGAGNDAPSGTVPTRRVNLSATCN